MRHSSGTPLHFKLRAMLRELRVPSGSPTGRCGYEAQLPDGWGFFRRGAVAQTATPIIRAGRIAGIPIRFWDFIGSNRDQKLFAHFGEAGTAIFTVKQVEYSGHDRTLA